MVLKQFYAPFGFNKYEFNFVILINEIYENNSCKTKWALVGARHMWFYDWLIDWLVVLIAIYEWFILFYVMYTITLNLFTNLCFPWNKWAHHSGTPFASSVHSVIFVLSDIFHVHYYALTLSLDSTLWLIAQVRIHSLSGLSMCMFRFSHVHDHSEYSLIPSSIAMIASFY